MKNTIGLLLVMVFLTSCNEKNKQETTSIKKDIEGTWRLVSAETTEKDSTFSTFNPKTKMIKIINDSHFAFFNHDLNNGKKADALFFGGGGKYTLKDSTYTENLEYFNNRDWENNKFEFTVKIKNDTLIQKGIEKVAKLGIDRIIIEKYVREK
jgi:UDP-N-acetylmuramate-alanine ligase